MLQSFWAVARFPPGDGDWVMVSPLGEETRALMERSFYSKNDPTSYHTYIDSGNTSITFCSLSFTLSSFMHTLIYALPTIDWLKACSSAFFPHTVQFHAHLSFCSSMETLLSYISSIHTLFHIIPTERLTPCSSPPLNLRFQSHIETAPRNRIPMLFHAESSASSTYLPY